MDNNDLYYDILQKKYNILKKNLIIIEQTEEKVNEFRNTIKSIDAIEQEKFKKELEVKKELTTNLEDEYKRLCDYINLIVSRKRNRDSMLDDYYNIVKEKISDLEEIEDYDSVDFYSKRLDDINEFFENDDKYNKLINEKNEYLSIIKEYTNKRDSLKDVLNDFEINLLIKLKNSIDNNDIYNKLDFDNIDDSIKDYDGKLNSKEKELNTYLNSYKVLVDNYITDDENEEYIGFISELKNDYLDLIEKKYILLIYKYINENNNTKALEVYEDRVNKLRTYGLNDASNLGDLFDIINNFMVKNEELIEIENTIETVDRNIVVVDEKINSVKDILNKDNIKVLLKEFCIEKEYIVNNNDSIKETLSFDENFINEEELRDFGENIESIDDNIEIVEKIDIDTADEVDEVFSNEDNNLLINIENDNIFDDNKVEENIVEEIELVDEQPMVINMDEVDSVENINSIDEVIYKDNAIKLIKDYSSALNIDEVVGKALKIMKSVCESVISV